MRLRVGVLLLILGTFRFAEAQSVEMPRIETPPRIEIYSISSGGSLATIREPVNINLSTSDVHISDKEVRRAVPNLRLDVKVIEIQPPHSTGPSEILIREDASTWRRALEAAPSPGPSIEPKPTIQPPAQPPVLWLTTTDTGPYKLLTQLVPPESGQNSWGWPKEGPFAINPANDVDALRGLLSNNPQLVIINNRGKRFPRDWFGLIKNSGRPYAIVTPESPNKSFEGIKPAAELGDRPIRANSVHVLSAFPKLDGWTLISDYFELHRMKLDFNQRHAWNRILSSIKDQQLPVPIEEATRESLRNELLNGNSDFVFLIAHNDGSFVYLPGSSGPISYDEIRGLQRSVAPNRTIVLVTCNGGVLNESPRTLADILLQNKLAKTVFAAQGDIYADTVPGLLKDLLVGDSNVRSTLIKYGYFQFVLRLMWARFDA
jgi:hypothetical protein